MFLLVILKIIIIFYFCASNCQNLIFRAQESWQKISPKKKACKKSFYLKTF